MSPRPAAKAQSYRGLAYLLPLVLLGCRSEADPAVVADHFVDAYYIEFDFVRAKTYAVGGALERLERELALVDAARQRTEIAQAKARVYYEQPERRQVGDDMFHATYPLEIREGHQVLSRQAVVMVAKKDGAWKVVQFRETTSGQVPPPGGPETRTATTGGSTP
ncbi:MAG: hypothetical protein IPG45_13745 [Deltaproteobacteria bacterium]|nr:hypothetical protein [Deltaproteobacteria bacterium]